MARIDDDLVKLAADRERFGQEVVSAVLPSGARLVEVRHYTLPEGWDHLSVTILFVAPPAYPAAQPDCFWVERIGADGAALPLVPGLRWGGGKTPQNIGDNNPVPEVGPRGTWFSWHLSSWDPNRDTLISYFKVIERRLVPPR